MRRPVCRVAGVSKEMPVGEKPAGFWAKAVPVPIGGAVAATIPAGLFAAAPVLAHTIQAGGARDYTFRLTTVTAAPDGSFAVAGIVRQSLAAALGGDPFGALTTAIILHLVAVESD